MRTNSRMRGLLRGAATVSQEPRLPEDVQAILQAGWVAGPGDALLLRAHSEGSTRRGIAPSDVGRYEYEVNDVYISLSDLVDDIDGYLAKAAMRGISFATQMLRNALSLPASDVLVATVGVWVNAEDEDFLLQGATVRFFSRRGDYPDWFDNLEAFKLEAIAVLDMSDVLDR